VPPSRFEKYWNYYCDSQKCIKLILFATTIYSSFSFAMSAALVVFESSRTTALIVCYCIGICTVTSIQAVRVKRLTYIHNGKRWIIIILVWFNYNDLFSFLIESSTIQHLSGYFSISHNILYALWNVFLN